MLRAAHDRRLERAVRIRALTGSSDRYARLVTGVPRMTCRQWWSAALPARHAQLLDPVVGSGPGLHGADDPSAPTPSESLGGTPCFQRPYRAPPTRPRAIGCRWRIRSSRTSPELVPHCDLRIRPTYKGDQSRIRTTAIGEAIAKRTDTPPIRNAPDLPVRCSTRRSYRRCQGRPEAEPWRSLDGAGA
jgi:hypothetical protein